MWSLRDVGKRLILWGECVEYQVRTLSYIKAQRKKEGKACLELLLIFFTTEQLAVFFLLKPKAFHPIWNEIVLVNVAV